MAAPALASSAQVDEALAARGLQSVLAPARRAGADAVAALLQDLAGVDWELLDRQRAALAAPPPAAPCPLEPPELLPPPARATPENEAAARRGWEALRAGRVAVATVAGGQASRLGFDAPKGTFPLAPVSGASLFQMLAGQVRRLRELSGAALPWIIQTGPENHADTHRFLERHNWFHLRRDSVLLVCQGTLPALSADGQLLLAAPDRLFRNPDGHGGFYAALSGSGALAELRRRGVDTLFSCQVDNALVRMGDPVFLGHHLGRGADMSAKVVEKTDPGEKVGMLARCGGRHVVLEYSDLPPELAARRAADGSLLYRAGNIAIHAFTLSFVEAMAGAQLPLHLARKKVRALDAGGQPVERDAVKFETFVFDAMPLARCVAVQLVERDEEFAPLKNRDGVDSIRTAREALDRRARRWCAAALPQLRLAEHGWVEIEPGLAYDAADLRSRAGEVELVACGRLLRRR